MTFSRACGSNTRLKEPRGSLRASEFIRSLPKDLLRRFSSCLYPYLLSLIPYPCSAGAGFATCSNHHDHSAESDSSVQKEKSPPLIQGDVFSPGPAELLSAAKDLRRIPLPTQQAALPPYIRQASRHPAEAGRHAACDLDS